jgi:hypothetical protein
MNSTAKKVTYRCSPLNWGIAALLLVFCAGLGWHYYDTKQKNKQKRFRLDSSIRGLESEISQLTSGFSDQKVSAVQEESRKIQAAMMTGEEVDAFITSLRPTWAITSRSEEANPEYIHRRYQIARGSAPVAIWPELRSFCEKLATMSAVSVNSIEMQTVGDSRRRDFSRITLNLSIYVRKTS